jgi:hypothetical protein
MTGGLKKFAHRPDPQTLELDGKVEERESRKSRGWCSPFSGGYVRPNHATDMQ